ncbi:MAG: hypothetical protein MJD61_15415, partial [Proteobacteria bacterium]|nr:hypothetical protein [Pseudomonadota bacterium]
MPRRKGSGSVGRGFRLAGLVALWVLALSCGRQSRSGKEIQSSRIALSGLPAQLTIALPGDMVPQDVAVAATGLLELEQGAKVQNEGASGEAATVSLGTAATAVLPDVVTRSLWSRGALGLGERVQVQGDARSEGAIELGTGAAVSGTIFANSSFGSLRESTWTVACPAQDGGSVEVGDNEHLSLDPGGYEDVLIGSASSLRLRAGTYLFSELTVPIDSQLRVDDSDGPVVVYLQGNLELGGSIVDALGDVVSELDLLVVAVGVDQQTVDGRMVGTLVAPNSTIVVQDVGPTGHAGAFFGSGVRVAENAIINHRPFPWNLVLPPTQVRIMDAPVILRAGLNHTDSTRADGTSSPADPVSFQLPATLPVRLGNAGNGTVELRYTDESGNNVVCSYVGGATVANPTTELERARGLSYNFSACDNGAEAGATVRGTGFTLTILSGDANAPSARTEVAVHLGGGCSGLLPPPMEPHEVVELKQRFAWRESQFLPETDPDGNPALRYGLIYVERPQQLEQLDKMGVFWSTLPLFREEIRQWFGSCGHFRKAFDEKGGFVFAVFQAHMYNIMRDAGTFAELCKAGELGAGCGDCAGQACVPEPAELEPPFRAIILSEEPEAGAYNSDGSLSYEALAEAGFHLWLEQRAAQQPFGIFRKAWDWLVGNVVAPVTSFVADTTVDVVAYATNWDGLVDTIVVGLDDIWEASTRALQAIGRIFSGRIDVHMQFNMLNRDPSFRGPGVPQPPMVRGWGDQGPIPIFPRGVRVRVKQWWGILPVTGEAKLDGAGVANVKAVEGPRSRDGGLCIELDNDDARMTSDFIPNELCDFRQDFDGFRHDLNLHIDTEHEDLHAMTQLVDSADYARTVIGRDPDRVEVLTGRVANVFTQVINGGSERAMVLCLDFPNIHSGTILSLGQVLGVLATTATKNVLLDSIIRATTVVIAGKDMFWPDKGSAILNLNSRGVMTHEYGHFLMCDLMFQEEGPSALLGLVRRVGEFEDDEREDDLTIHAEAFADTFAMQVVGGYNYTQTPGSTDGFGNSMRYCRPWFLPPPPAPTLSCAENNYRGMNEDFPHGDQPFHDELARYTTLIHDAFDRSDSSARSTNAPWNGDVWGVVLDPANPAVPLGLEFSAAPYIHVDDEPVGLPGRAWQDWIHHVLERGAGGTTFLSREDFFGGLSDAMAQHGADWCQRCEVFSLHTHLTAGQPNIIATPADRVRRWEACLLGVDWDGPLVSGERFKIEEVLGEPVP